MGGVGKGCIDPPEDALAKGVMPSVNATVAKLHSFLHTDLDICILWSLHASPSSDTTAQGHNFRWLSCLRDLVIRWA